jgi:hypothetical protein
MHKLHRPARRRTGTPKTRRTMVARSRDIARIVTLCSHADRASWFALLQPRPEPADLRAITPAADLSPRRAGSARCSVSQRKLSKGRTLPVAALASPRTSDEFTTRRLTPPLQCFAKCCERGRVVLWAVISVRGHAIEVNDPAQSCPMRARIKPIDPPCPVRSPCNTGLG